MIEIARVSRRSAAPGSRFFERWCDLPSHPTWAPSMESFVLDGPFELGATGRSRAVGGGETRFTVTRIGPGWVYADTTELEGAFLTVLHEAADSDDGTVVTLTGLLEGDRSAVDGEALRVALDRDLASLIALLESSDARPQASFAGSVVGFSTSGFAAPEANPDATISPTMMYRVLSRPMCSLMAPSSGGPARKAT